ncbi:MAG: NuoM family protein [Planctomycetota bacterium]|nr:NADH-quinone oxidoreductase subunit M [Planctomycetota bacterium]
MNELTYAIFLPLVGMLAVLLTNKEKPQQARVVGFLFTLVTFGLCTLVALQCFNAGDVDGYHYRVQAVWIDLGGSFQVHYSIGVDGLSGMLIFLTGLLGVCAALASWNIKQGTRGYWAMFLLLHTGVIGTFASLDLFLFYVFWEIVLLPMYFLIGVWGGPRRRYAAIKFFLYTLFGSVFLLAGILVTYFALTATGSGFAGNPFSIPEITAYARVTDNIMAPFGESAHTIATLVFWGLFVAFAIKVPVFPFHTWLPDAHVEAPTPISVILAGILLKLGAYGMLRIGFPFFPKILHEMAFYLGVLGMINIIYGALVAMAQTDFKRLVAYSSVSHMGFVILGFAAMTPESLNGAILMMFNHGTISGLLFLVVGVVYDRAHHRDLGRFGGLMWNMPIYAAISGVAIFASLGLPGLSGFIGEILTLLGSFKTTFYEHAGLITVVCTIGLVLTAAYYLRALQRVFLGETNPECESFPDVDTREIGSMVPLLVPTIVFGIYPAPLIDLIQGPVSSLVLMVKSLG